MVSVIGSATLFFAITALCSIALSRYTNSRRRRRAFTIPDSDVDDVSTEPLDAAHPVEDSSVGNVTPTVNQPSPSAQTAPSPSVKKARTHRRSPHLISYANDSDDEQRVRTANSFSWKQFFIPARHIAFGHLDSESAVGEGYKPGSLSISPSRPVVFGGGDEKDGGDRASMCVVLTPPSPEVRPRPSEGDISVVEEVRTVVDNEIEAAERSKPLLEQTSLARAQDSLNTCSASAWHRESNSVIAATDN